MLVVSESFKDTIHLFAEKSKVLSFFKSALSSTYFNKRCFDTKNINFVSLRKEGDENVITFISENRVVNETTAWQKEKRQSAKIGRTLRSLISSEYRNLFNEQDFEIATNILKSTNNVGVFEIVTGEDIIETYVNLPIFKSSGSLGGSCMRYTECEDFFDIYVENPDVCQLLRLVHPNGKIMGRALLWKTDCGQNIMDRIYTCKDGDIEAFKNWAEENGYHYKEHQAYDEKTSWINSKTGKSYDRIYEISLKTDWEKFPYIDTFTFGRHGVIHNDDNPIKSYHTYDNGNGERDEYDIKECQLTNEFYRTDFIVEIQGGEKEGLNALEELTVIVNNKHYWKEDSCLKEDSYGKLFSLEAETHIEVDGKYYHINLLSYSHSEETWFLDTDERFIWNEEEKDFILKQN